MILWPLSIEHLQMLQDALRFEFGSTHKTELINDANAGYIAYSETDKDGKTNTTINVSEPVILRMITEEHMESFAEHQRIHLKGKNDHDSIELSSSPLNPPEATPNLLWGIAQQLITDAMQDLVKCTNVILQQQLAKDFVEFECKKFEYIYEKHGSAIFRAARLITYGYLDALCAHFKVDYKMQRKDVWDTYDLCTYHAAKEVFEELLLSLQKEENSVNLYDRCIKLDMNIRKQKKIF